MAETPKGLFKTPAVATREAEVCVTDGTIQSFIPKSIYQANEYRPDFDALPNREEYSPMPASNDNAARP
jgi:hypothetical protein